MFSRILAAPIDAIVHALQYLFGLDKVSTLVYNLDPASGDVLTGNIGPFYPYEWTLIGRWYFALAGFLGAFILLAIAISAYKMAVPGKDNPGERAEAKMGIVYSVGAILVVMATPLFFQLFAAINNSLVNFFYMLAHGVLKNELDLVGTFDALITNDWNPLVAAIVKFAAWGAVVGVNILYVIRKMMLVVLLISTPVLAGMWAASRSKYVIEMWAGEILTNLFMQTAHAMVWTLLLVFLKVWTS
ncbi:hypothetical protein SDD30_14085 [Moorella naiadis]|uniref:hypothetical protein n=1 Tax=Moorella naiadis (nom. illeg.) TaxID=3093670 RepID=UPI003D9CAE87